MTFDEWLDEEDATGKTNRDCINDEVDLAKVMTGHMSHNLARRRLYDWLEKAYTKSTFVLADLIKRDDALAAIDTALNNATGDLFDCHAAIRALPTTDRIEMLVVERDEAVEKLIDQQDEKSIRIRELEAKLAKLDNAAELMRLALPILKKYLQHPNDIWLVDDFRAMLGELEGGE